MYTMVNKAKIRLFNKTIMYYLIDRNNYSIIDKFESLSKLLYKYNELDKDMIIENLRSSYTYDVLILGFLYVLVNTENLEEFKNQKQFTRINTSFTSGYAKVYKIIENIKIEELKEKINILIKD